MQGRKLRILMNSEATYTYSGFGTYYNEVLKRLAATGKYELAELASYGFVNDPRDKDCKWTVYANCIKDDDPRINAYRSKPTFQWGEWRLDRTMLDFKPDILMSIRDPWMLEFEKDSAFRRFVHLVWMPTVDSAPQAENWIDSFIQADGIFTYSDWALNVLRHEGNGQIKLQRSAPPGVNLNIFCPVKDKREHRKHMNVNPDWYIIGSVMRNQRRKLYPDMFIAFQKFLETADPEIAKKTYLLIHTSYPDAGWSLPNLLKLNKVGHRVLFSYLCRTCNNWFASHFQDITGTCPHCGNTNATFPNVQAGVTQEVLANIYKCMDVYVQYSICLTGNQEVLTYQGWKPISQVTNGDLVWTHSGSWQYVTQTFKNPNKNNLKKISVCSDYETLEITDNHPVYCYTKDILKSKDNKRSVREIIGTRLYNNRNIPKPQFVPVSSLNKGDMIVYPIDDTVSWIDHQDISWAKSENDTLNITGDIQVNKGDKYPSHIKIDGEFCRFIGLFASDGGREPHLIKITSHVDETINQALATSILDKLSYNKSTTRLYPDRKGIDNHLCSVLHSKVFTNWFYTESLDKKLPHWVFTLPVYLQKEIIAGMCMGDGCYSEGNVTIYVTTSKQLANDFKVLLRRCRINYNVNTKQKKGNRKLQYRFEIAGNIKNGEFVKSEIRSSTSNLYYDNNYLIKIKNIKDIVSNDNYVYNIEVDRDNSYTTRIGTIHNCEGFGMPQVEAAACGVPTMGMPYSATSDILKYTDGIPLKIAKAYLEPETQAYRMMPDNDDLCEQWIKFFNMPQAMRQRLGFNARRGCEIHYDWDKTAKIWENYFDNIQLTGCQGQWDTTPFQPYNPPEILPEQMKKVSAKEFVDWLYIDVLKSPKLCQSFLYMKLCSEVESGLTIEGMGARPINREQVFNIFRDRAKNAMIAEQARCNMIQLPIEDYIEYAHLKQKALLLKDGELI